MLFNIVIYNHGLKREFSYLLEPLIDPLCRAIGKAGHDVLISFDQFHCGAINLLVEHFVTHRSILEDIVKAKNAGAKIGVLATELIIDGEIPYAKGGISCLDRKGNAIIEEDFDNYIYNRIIGFSKVLQHADFAWSLFERTMPFCRKFCKNVQSLQYGYQEPFRPVANIEKDIDVLFFGGATSYRKTVLQSIAEQGIGVLAVGGGFPTGRMPDILLDSLIDRSRIIVNLTLNGPPSGDDSIDSRIVSHTRVSTLLSRGACVISEEVPFDNPYWPYLINVEPSLIPIRCKQLLKSGKSQAIVRRNAERFKTEMDAGAIMVRVIRDTFHPAATHRPA
ncbi:hypothetical protein [Azospirillum isscasi]|uniref:Glycosyltransferase family 1 protein n=1 Tax=Azospirillum isscasi TaxID=3053926 RepID=A0ABU0WR49_9PROT|nr:hypothetical protein [Azospirillum isscasi]MDQ2105264.1 hypothetical protein [Azospirillum isscasi]